MANILPIRRAGDPVLREKARRVRRPVKGMDPVTGKEVRIRAENDLLAECLEHEIDHINGILYIDYLDGPDALVPLEDAPEGQE